MNHHSPELRLRLASGHGLLRPRRRTDAPLRGSACGRAGGSRWTWTAGFVALGLGADNLTSGHADPTVKLLWSYSGGDLPDWLAIGGNLIASYPTESGDRFSQTAASLYASISPTGTDTSFFVEWYVVAPYANHLDEAHTADAGVVQRLSRTTAVDTRVGFGLDQDADDLFAGLGFSVLF